MQGSFEHLHVLLLADCKWVKFGSNNLCAKEEELFKGTIVVAAALGKFNSHRLQLFQVPLCAIFSSYCSHCWALIVVVVCVASCDERKDDVATLVWCMGIDQLMMGDDEPVRLGPIASFCDNDNCLAKSLLSIVWHNFVFFFPTLVDFVVGNFVVQELFLVFFFFPLPNRGFQGFSNVTINCWWTLVVILTSPTSFFTFLWTLILPWQSLLVFSPLLPIVHGSVSKFDVYWTS